ncbi:SpoIID/LytB domain-containing protein [Neobacillus cucumis]|uniref:SpoIID/LytB domain-containing protein n=1 Tax=Neobacillus cucumis TaxID=1740721 RepID=UPI002852FDE4|nr:SpoIID/LytB domain-containing protein [Neobacillus cucumis]MDR4949952.1 SpoIID/LytB domain-containing protein [Neobacillus cucumis]
MKKLLSLFVIAFVLLGFIPNPPAAAGQEPQMQIKLINYLANKTSIPVKVTGTYYLNGTTTKLSTAKTYTVKVITVKQSDGTIKPYISLYDGTTKLSTKDNLSIKTSNRSDTATLNNHTYLGSFNFTVDSGKYVSVVNTLYMEDYIKCVVPSEMYTSWNKEALKVQAVAARTYAYYRVGKPIDDTTRYQDYEGTAKLSANTTAATQDTAGQILTYSGKVIDTLFSSSNGGMTESNYNAFGSTQLPYYPVQKDSYDTQRVWSVTIHNQQINKTSLDLSNPGAWWDNTNEADQTISTNIKTWLSKNGYANKQIKIVSIPKLTFYEKTTSGRVKQGDIQFTFFVKDKLDSTGKLQLQTISYTGEKADKIRSILGTTQIQSTLMSKISATSTAYTIAGSGYGHGVGMSQYGANNRAAAGFKYNSILSFYYPTTVLTKPY